MIEYHNHHLAINVKDYPRHIYNQLSQEYSQSEIYIAYKDCKESFWTHYAPNLAEKYGYGKVFSEGRSDGWLVVENEPRVKMTLALPGEGTSNIIKNKKDWEDFSREILAEMEYCCTVRLKEVLEEIRVENTI